MGNNLCARVGIDAGRTISRNDFGSMWVVYEDEKGHLSYEHARKFLEDFAHATGVIYKEEIADALIKESDPQNRGYLDYWQFQKLFFSVAKSENMTLTQSLELELEEDEATKESKRKALQDKPSSAAEAELDTVWLLFQEALTSFFHSDDQNLRKSASTPKEWMGLYSTAYSYCSSPIADVVGLYKRLSSFLEEEGTSISKRAPGSEQLISFYLERWEIYSKAANRTNTILKGLDKYIAVKLPSQFSVLELCWVQWATYFMLPLQKELVQAFQQLLDKPDKTPEQEQQIKAVLKSCQTLELNVADLLKEHNPNLNVDLSPYLDSLSLHASGEKSEQVDT